MIGEPLPYERIIEALPALHGELKEDGWSDAAEAIMTTDTFPKLATRQCQVGGVTVTLNGIAKGSGMIAPDMATMLAFIATDAAIPPTLLQLMLAEATATSFNAITVDSDTSTSDTLLLFATGAAGNAPDSNLSEFRTALKSLCLELAHLIVKDGEGASKFVTIIVEGAESDAGRQSRCHERRQLAADQNRHRRARPQLGPSGHGRRQIRPTRRPRQSCKSGSASISSPKTASATPATTKKPWPT